ncbi:hypothetical protein [uncultured Marinobacter sp.]|uniref:hypothetical protein n=1 Tax=uncultured Marinobacter sp. TaxID=187379 RepID=UPI0030DC26FC|tara:strand:+ start:2988 stop:3539 length:552 start_codon:yes stop_codon:yes gene_type:complete
MSKPKQLTSKQQKFCREVASGKSYSDAYRASYNVKPSTTARSTNTISSRLAGTVEIQYRVKQLIEARERGSQARALSQADLVAARLREAIDDEGFGPNRLKALDLMARISGLYAKSEISIENKLSDDPEAITAALVTKLAELGITLDGPEQGSEGDPDDHAGSDPVPEAPAQDAAQVEDPAMH